MANDFARLLGLSKETVLLFSKQYRIYRQEQKGRPPSLLPGDEILLGLLWLRHYPVNLFLGVAFGIAERTARDIHDRVLHWLYATLKDHLAMRSLDFRLQRAEMFFSHNITWIIDGSEQPVTHSDEPILNIEFHSEKKKMASINILLIIALDGTILFVSSASPGQRNDRELARQTKDLWHSELDPSEFGMGDSGFSGLWDMRILTPPAQRGKLYGFFSSIRIRIEQRIAHIKDWDICCVPLRTSPAYKGHLITLADMAWTVVCVFVNDFLCV